MDLTYAIQELTHNAEAVERLARHASDQQARWKPAPEEWSLLEAINHLYDEERSDFRLRLDLTLHQPGTPWPPNDASGGSPTAAIMSVIPTNRWTTFSASVERR